MSSVLKTKSRGSAYIELALVLPMLLLLVFAALEFAASLRLQQRIAMFSREAANTAFRQCSEEADSAEVAICLQTTTDTLSGQANALLPGSTFVASVYRLSPSGCDLAGGACALETIVYPNGGVAGSYQSKFNTAQFSAGGEFNNLLNMNRVVAIGEIFFDYQPLVPWVGDLFYSGRPERYDVALF